MAVAEALARHRHRVAGVAAVAGAAALLVFAANRLGIAAAAHLRTSARIEAVSKAEVTPSVAQSLLPVRLALQAAPDKCVSVRREGPDNGKELVLWDCDTNPDAFVVAEGFAQGQIRWASQPSLCLEASGGDRLRLWDCSQPPLVGLDFKVGGGSEGAIRWAAHPDKCVRVATGEGYQNGARLSIGDCGADGDKETRFQLQIVRLDCSGISWTWSEWSSCSKPCGGGYRLRSRKVDISEGGGTCHDIGGETKSCNSAECTSELLAELHGRGGGHAKVYGGTSQSVRISSLADPSKCLAAERIELVVGMRLQLRECGDEPGDFLVPEGFGRGLIRWTKRPELCLDAPGGARLRLQNCSHVDARTAHFSFDARAGRGTISQAALPYKCLDVPDVVGVGDAGPFVQMSDCDSTQDSRQRFGFTFFYQE